MKILINLGRFSGGAPLSILEYAKIAKKNGFDIIAVGEYKSVEKRYEKDNIKTYNIPYFTISRFFENFKSFFRLHQIIKKEKPDIIHATSYGIIPAKFMGTYHGIPVIYSIAGGKISSDLKLKNEDIIVYSEENRDDLINIGYSPNNIEVISNRLKVAGNNKPNQNVYESADKIKLLLISRIDIELINSIIHIINLTKDLSSEFPQLTLDIIGDGKLRNEIEKRIDQVNRDFNRQVICLHGFVDKPIEFIENSHIVFGKGRSILEAILARKIAFIVGEDYRLSLCSVDSLQNLYKYNFSGRHISLESSKEELNDIINYIVSRKVDLEKLETVAQRVDRLYNIEHAKDRILEIYNGKLNRSYNYIKKSRVCAFVFILRYYVCQVTNIKKIINKLFMFEKFSKNDHNYGSVKK